MRRRTLLLAAPTVLVRSATAQTTLPDRALRIIVGFVSNGGADLMARSIAPALERRVGRRVTVENRPEGGAVFSLRLRPAAGLTAPN